MCPGGPFPAAGVRGAGHALFRWESLLNTPLFVGFPGFVSKLWLAGDEHGFYRGLYERDCPARAEHCARCLWRVLALVPVPGSIGYRVVPGIRPAGALSDASATVPEQVTMWLPMVPRSRARAVGNRLGRIKGQDG